MDKKRAIELAVKALSQQMGNIADDAARMQAQMRAGYGNDNDQRWLDGRFAQMKECDDAIKYLRTL